MEAVSLFAGIGGFDLGFERSGMNVALQCEQSPRCRSVLARHFPGCEITDDVTSEETRNAIRRIRPELICGGFPCQDVSLAGKRKGLAGKRSGLWFTFRDLLAEFRPRWVCIENVPGLLSSCEGRDMGTILWGLGKLGYGWAYRVFDAQWFRVAQRRQRVFIVGCLGDAARAAEVLFERTGLPWDYPPSREAGANAAATLTSGTSASRGVGPVNCIDAHMGMGGADDNAAQAGHIIAETFCPKISPCIKARDHKGPSSDGDGDGAPLIAHTLRAEGFDASEDGTGRGTPIIPVAYQCHGSNVGPMGTLRTGNGNEGGGVPFLPVAYRTSGNCGVMEQGDRTGCLNCASDPNQQIVLERMAVRRLTPRECERLQGFPDDWTRWGHDGTELSDSARYQMLGNAVCGTVSTDIGESIMRSH